MEKSIRCCFAGHGDLYYNKIKERVKKTAENLINNYGVNEFWVGNYGNFDACAEKAVKELKKDYSEIELDLVIPYLTNDIKEYSDLYYKRFDNIIVSDVPLTTPKRFYIIKTNEFMIDSSQFLICYVERSWGGAKRTLEYAQKRNIQIINLAET